MAFVLIYSREDSSSFIQVVAEMGHRVLEAHDSGHVLQLVMRRRLDVVVLPEDAEPVNGEGLLTLVRRLSAAAIIVVGEGTEMKMTRALFRGADAYLPYPLDHAQLRGRLRAFLRPRRVRDTVESEDLDGPRY